MTDRPVDRLTGHRPDDCVAIPRDGDDGDSSAGMVRSTQRSFRACTKEVYAGGNFVTAGGDPRANFAAVARARAGETQVYLPLITR